MGRYQLKLLGLTIGALLALVTSVLVMDWFTLAGNSRVRIDLQNLTACIDKCFELDVKHLGGMYSVFGMLTFWGSIIVMGVLAVQVGARLYSDSPSEKLTRTGYSFGVSTLGAGFMAGYLFTPDTSAALSFVHAQTQRTIAPLLFLAGAVLALVALRAAATGDVDEGEAEYKPVVLAKKPDAHKDGPSSDAGRIPATPLSINKQPTPVAGAAAAEATRPKSPSSIPLAAERTKAPTNAPVATTERTKAPTAAPLPVDLAARLEGAPLELAPLELAPFDRGRPAEPNVPSVATPPTDQIPVAPESGLTIRKRTPSAGPLRPESIPIIPEAGLVLRTKAPSQAPSMASIHQALSDHTPPKLRGRVSYAVTSAAFSGAGITAHREDGFARLVKWSEIVGVVARRLPPVAPYDGATFIDIVSSAGATLRILPWSEITGHDIAGDADERARRLVQLLAAQCADAKLDNATKGFANGSRPAAQLPDDKTLAAHDQRLA